jgi:hypothetical protein
LADRFVLALRAEPRIELLLGTRVLAVARSDYPRRGRFVVQTPHGWDGPYDAVVNALWQGRLAIDRTLGLAPPGRWSHRFRLSVFVRSAEALRLPCAVVVAGPFGDVKNYNDRDFYLSWYPTGLLAQGHGVEPPPVPARDAALCARTTASTFEQLGRFVPGVRILAQRRDSLRLEGGWVFAAGDGSLADPTSTLHRRDHVGFQRQGNYISVDTGKYSIAPWLARAVAASLLGRVAGSRTV